MKRSRLKHKPRRGDKPRVRREYRNRHFACAGCGRIQGYDPSEDVFYVLDVAHILGGLYGRVDDERNLLLLCRCVAGEKNGCHDRQHASEITLSDLLRFKASLGELDREFLQGLMGNRRLPETAVT